MNYIENPPQASWTELLRRPVVAGTADENAVLEILRNVRERGDEALFEYALRFDGVEQTTLRVTQEEFANAEQQVSPELRQAIQIAAENIECFHRSCVHEERPIETRKGVTCWRKPVAIEKVGLYIPGGSAPLFSTVLMLGIPGKIAGCARVILCTPPGRDGIVHPAILFAARMCGITEVYKVGGAQAIAAMRYGTQSVPAVAKIFGPGNSWVTMAKQLLARDGFPIDMPAGPSELAVFADASADPSFVAADLLSQAEHGSDSQILLVSTHEEFIRQVREQVQIQLIDLPRREMATRALDNSLAILVSTSAIGMQLINEYAPEHLILACADAEQLASAVVNAGSVFIGQWSPESAGDYASGTNHTLPTSGNARAWSGVSVDSFVKKITFQRLSREGLSEIAETVVTMAEAEGLQAHANAISIRLK